MKYFPSSVKDRNLSFGFWIGSGALFISLFCFPASGLALLYLPSLILLCVTLPAAFWGWGTSLIPLILGTLVLSTIRNGSCLSLQAPGQIALFGLVQAAGIAMGEGLHRRMLFVNTKALHCQKETERLKRASCLLNGMIYDWNVKTGHVQYFSDTMKLLGCPLKEVQPNCRWWSERIHPEDRAQFDFSLSGEPRVIEGQREYRVRREDNLYRWVLDRSHPVYREDGVLLHVIGCITDVTGQHEALERIQAHQQEIEALNLRMEMTLKETNYRVKNHLQAISSLAELSCAAGKPVGESDLKRIGLYARSLALLHELLMETSQETAQQFTSASVLIGRLLPLLQVACGERVLCFHETDFPLTLRQSAALSLVICELVNNSLKHGSGEIRLSLQPRGVLARLVVQDQGQGFPPGFDAASFSHFGIKVMNHLVHHDLRGKIRYGSPKCSCSRVVVRFRLLDQEGTLTP